MRNVIFKLHKRALSPHIRRAISPVISSQSTRVRNIHVRNVITRLHGRELSPLIRILSTWIRNNHVRNVYQAANKSNIQNEQCKCDYQATRKSDRTIHQQSVHMGKKYQCEEFDYQANWKSDLNTSPISPHS